MQRANWYSLMPPSCRSLRASRFLCSCRSPVPGTCTEPSAGLGNYCASQLTRKDSFPSSCFQWQAGSMLFHSLLQKHSVGGRKSWKILCSTIDSVQREAGILKCIWWLRKFHQLWNKYCLGNILTVWLVVQRGWNTILSLLLNPLPIHLSWSLPHMHTKNPQTKQNKKPNQE